MLSLICYTCLRPPLGIKLQVLWFPCSCFDLHSSPYFGVLGAEIPLPVFWLCLGQESMTLEVVDLVGAGGVVRLWSSELTWHVLGLTLDSLIASLRPRY